MQLVFLRHATRSAYGLNDSPLNETGLAQAQELPNALMKLLKLESLEQIVQVISSPKLRACQTVYPLSQKLPRTFKIDPRLDERGEGESATEFEARLRAVLKDLPGHLAGHLAGSLLTPPTIREAAASSAQTASAPSAPQGANVSSDSQVILLCSHMDWLELAMLLAPSDLTPTQISWTWQPAEFRSFELAPEPNSVWKFKKRGAVAPGGTNL